jgi:integrase
MVCALHGVLHILGVGATRRGVPRQSGPIFATGKGTRQSMNNLLKRTILPALNRCEQCRKPEVDHAAADHEYRRDSSLPEWHGWHSCRRGLGTNLNHLGVPDVVIQRILRHANVSTTTGYYIKAIPADVRAAMGKLENSIPEVELDSFRTLDAGSTKPM